LLTDIEIGKSLNKYLIPFLIDKIKCLISSLQKEHSNFLIKELLSVLIISEVLKFDGLISSIVIS